MTMTVSSLGEAARFAVAVLVLLTVATPGCGGTLPKCPGESPAKKAQQARSDRLPAPQLDASAVRTRIDTRPEFHNVAVAFRAYPASYPFYLLGFEKPRDNSARPYCAPAERGCAAPVFDPDAHLMSGLRCRACTMEDRCPEPRRLRS